MGQAACTADHRGRVAGQERFTPVQPTFIPVQEAFTSVQATFTSGQVVCMALVRTCTPGHFGITIGQLACTSNQHGGIQSLVVIPSAARDLQF
jgi:hypothetical protein